MAEKDAWYVAARGGFVRDGSCRMALLAGPYETRQEAEAMVKPVSQWAAEHCGDQWSCFYEYGVLALPPDLAASRLGAVTLDSGWLAGNQEYRQVLAEAAGRELAANARERGMER